MYREQALENFYMVKEAMAARVYKTKKNAPYYDEAQRRAKQEIATIKKSRQYHKNREKAGEPAT